MTQVTEKIAIEHGLKKEEFSKICELLKRTPNITELAIFSAMWNEHCSYKSSRKHLKKQNALAEIVSSLHRVIFSPSSQAQVQAITMGVRRAVTMTR